MEIHAADVLRWYLRLGETAFLSWYAPLLTLSVAIVLFGGKALRRQAFTFRAFIQALKAACLPLVFLTLGGVFLFFPVECADFFRHQKDQSVVFVGAHALYGSVPAENASATDGRQDFTASPPFVRAP